MACVRASWLPHLRRVLAATHASAAAGSPALPPSLMARSGSARDALDRVRHLRLGSLGIASQANGMQGEALARTARDGKTPLRHWVSCRGVANKAASSTASAASDSSDALASSKAKGTKGGDPSTVVDLQGLLVDSESGNANGKGNSSGNGNGQNRNQQHLLVDAFPEGASSVLTEGVPRGLAMELESSSATHLVHRAFMAPLAREILSNGNEGDAGAGADACGKYLLDGPRGVGKSVALSLLVALARSKGWIVVYLPSASKLLHGGTYNPIEHAGANGGAASQASQTLWDTPNTAAAILAHLQEAHGDALKALDLHPDTLAASAPSSSSSSTATAAKAKAKAKTKSSASKKRNVPDNPSANANASAMLHKVLNGLGAQRSVPVMVAVDDYDALFARTRYTMPSTGVGAGDGDGDGDGTWVAGSQQSLRIPPHLLYLVCMFRWLERPRLARGCVVAATSSDSGRGRGSVGASSTFQRVPRTDDCKVVTVPPISHEEACAMLHGGRDEAPNGLKTFVAAAGGNGHEIRKLRAFL